MSIYELLFTFIVILPTSVLGVLGLNMLIYPKTSENLTAKITTYPLVLSLLFLSVLVPVTLFTDHQIALEGFRLIDVGSYHMEFSFILHAKEAIFLWVANAMTLLIAIFSRTYLHRETNFKLFYLLLTVSFLGIVLVATAKGLNIVLIGWEFLALSSILLISFYSDRDVPLNNALQTYRVYRTSDIGLLVSVVLLHHFTHHSDIHSLAALEPEQLQLVMFFVILGAMGKGAIFPFSYWLPKAMEGPTPSSAVFYGALSVHLSPFLLLRVMPELPETETVIHMTVIGLGLATALYGTLVSRVQSDIKATLAFATLAQIGLIWAEIGMGWYAFAVIHIIGNASLRLHQLLRAPSLLHDRQHIIHHKNANLVRTGKSWSGFGHGLYYLALNRFFLEDIWNKLISIIFYIIDKVDNIEQNIRNVLDGQSTKGERK